MNRVSFTSLLRQGARVAFVAAALLGTGVLEAKQPPLTIEAKARVTYRDISGVTHTEADSNVVLATTPEVHDVLAFTTDDSFKTPTLVGRAGQPMFPWIDASSCNVDPLARDTITVTMKAAISGQTSTHIAVETSPNSGSFVLRDQVSSRTWSAGAPPAAGIHDVMPGDVIEASTPDCQGGTIKAVLRFDPRSVVFDAATGQRLAGVRVRLIDVTGQGNGGNPGGPAVVFAADGVTPMPNDVVTDADGSYSFPFLKPSTYRLLVSPSGTYTYPSTNEAHREAGWAGAYQVDASGSYGGTFVVTAATGSAVINLPIDPLPRGLLVRNIASRSIAEIAETLEYTVSVKNVGEVDLGDIRLHGLLPLGMRYLPGSAKLDNQPVADPTGGIGPHLEWPVTSTLVVAGEHTLRYRVRIGTGALQGDGVNNAQATGRGPELVRSNVATARVKVDAGVFSDKAFVLGTVYADCNRNGVKDDGEPGVPGVRVWMEDGTSAVTDTAGRYSFYGLSPRTHVLKLDAVTLPAGTEPVAISQRHAGDGASRFVDPRSGELQRADFALAGCGPAVQEQLKLRQQSARQRDEEATSSLRTALTATPTAMTQDVRALPASGRVGELNSGLIGVPAAAMAAAPAGKASGAQAGTGAAVPAISSTAPGPTTSGAAIAAAPSASAVASAAEPAAAASATAAPPDTSLPRFIDVRDGQVLAATASSIRLVGHMGATITLSVNGTPVGNDRIGERAQSADDQTETRTYIGLPLKAGENRLTLQEHDNFGNLRATRELTVRQAGALARIVVEAPERVEAGATVPVRLRLEDSKGLPVDGRLPVTLPLGPGRWSVPDLDPRTPELQTFVEGGDVQLQWQAPDAPGEARLRVGSDGITTETRVAIVAALRPLMAVGLVDAAINLRRLKASQVQPAGGSDGFEQELRTFASSDGAHGDVRSAVFLKGKVRGDTLLTLAYDSDKDKQQRLFRDIQPDAFYPVYGDASEKGFDAQSTGRLYVRLDRGQSSLLYGDFTTQSDDPTRQLGVYQRSLNGLKHHLQTEGLATNVYASRDNTRQMVVELPANGTSGPFALAGDMAENSEKVEILVRSRNQPALVISTITKERFTDYDIEPLTGRLLFRAPIPSLDADLNPISIRITYEVEQGGPSFWVAGADAQWQATESLQVGGSVVRDWNPMAAMQMGSANARYQIAEKTVLSAEVARVDRDETVEGKAAHAGNAERMELKHDGEQLKVRAHAARSDVGFDNLSSMINSGRSEAGAQATYLMDENTRLTGDALYTGDLATDSRRIGVLVGVERRLAGGAKVELGARHVRQLGGSTLSGEGTETLAGASDTTTSVRAKASMVVPGLPLATVFIEGEQDVQDNDKRLLAIGGDYQVAGRGRVYLRHELISSLTGPYALDPTQRRNTTVLGLDMGAGLGGGDGRVFSEYRGREAFDGRQTEAAMGLRNQWLLRPGLRVNASLERVHALQGGKGDNESAAATGAVEYTADPRWKGTARLEWRESAGNTGVLSTLGLAYKLNDDWTLLGKNVLAGTLAHGEGKDRWQERFQLGTAYRDKANRLNALARYEYKDERGSLNDADARRAHVVSVHAERQIDRRTEVTGRFAAKVLTETVDGIATRTIAQLASGRITRDLGNRWDVGLNLGIMGDARLRSRQTAVGGEVGYRAKDNLWVSLGYNIQGFKDRDMSADDATQRGVYVRLRFKFDENLFSRLSS